MDVGAYRRLRSEARRHVRDATDADDLVQDALLVALEQGRDPLDATSLPWLSGVIRHRAAMQARSAIRRRRRDAAFAIAADEATPSPATPGSTIAARALLARLPPAARRVAVLALHGLAADEIRWILGIRDTAFRQRLTCIRKALGAMSPAQRAEAIALAYVRDPARSVDLQFGQVRRALKAALGGRPGLGSHDPDGHLLVLRGRAHVSPGGGN
ncbi:MAG: sigma-70 family RNA polymerase sigma factor [Lysobacter sp.]|nr:sigma-70 family RNA polymerase sigma factor [Lysobacter sp.]